MMYIDEGRKSMEKTITIRVKGETEGALAMALIRATEKMTEQCWKLPDGNGGMQDGSTQYLYEVVSDV